MRRISTTLRSIQRNRLTLNQSIDVEVSRNLSLLVATPLDQYFEFIDRVRYTMPLKWMLTDNLNELLGMQVNYEMPPKHIESILQTINHTIDTHIRGISYNRFSIHIRLEGIFAHAKAIYHAAQETSNGGSAGNGWIEYLWEGDPFLWEIYDMKDLRTRTQIQEHALAFKDKHDNQEHNHFNKGYFEFGVVTAATKETEDNTLRLVLDRSSAEDIQKVKAKVRELIGKVSGVGNPQYDARRFDGGTIMDVLRVHPLTIIRGELVHNPYFVEPEAFLEELRRRSA